MSISTPAWTSTSFFLLPTRPSRLSPPPVRKKKRRTLSENPIKGGPRIFCKTSERSRPELRAVSYREADVRGRESRTRDALYIYIYIGIYLYYICVVHISGYRSASYSFVPSTYLSHCIDTYTGGISRARVSILYLAKYRMDVVSSLVVSVGDAALYRTFYILYI